ncbi:NAD(P)/FAD-dependent oxidoreductase [Fictibacillus phosphorivorans]|uniref:NAD(P)/FAD-dependent oxidoreductase n=1 Tax=Fictibacillus phosphorivorans TaxID=1221500 RepID=UPI00203C5198|nr:FAD-dependent oxidoreductase [Fictibacillus phosphorivorans]MCM3719491.1 FAD-binding oxidoreductase [Fictibacillus phosphorivorans]MCM3777182.1 FAD-binding oxidoreductase [Fictibacillus phosphorivorans]
MQNMIVIGSGVLGASTAYHLAKLGAEVTLVDRGDKGQATDAAAGIVCPWLSQRRNKAWYQLVKGGARYYPKLIAQLEADGEYETGYKRVGTISLHSDPEKLEKMADRAIKRREDAPEIGEVRVLSPSETQRLFPPIGGEYGSVFVSGGARVNGRALRNALVNAAVKNGAKVIKGDASILYEKNKVLGINLEGKTLLAEKVIVTAGAWSQELLKPLGVNFKVTPQKAQIVHLELPQTETDSWPVVMPPTNQYILTFEGGRVVVGATHEDEAGFDYRITAGGINEILTKSLAVAPGLADSTMIETRVGFRPFTPGFLPVIGPLPDYENILLANGLGASGLTSGPYLGAELAKLALHQGPEIDISNYDVAGAIENLI